MLKSEIRESWFQEPSAGQLDALREEARKKQKNHRVTFDCFNSIVVGARVQCRQGKVLNSKCKEDSGMPLASVLRGRTAKICQDCSNYNDKAAPKWTKQELIAVSMGSPSSRRN